MARSPRRQHLKRLLSRGPSGIWVGFTDGGVLSSLVGSKYEIEGTRLSVDLTRNFRVTSKESLCYGEICELMESPGKVAIFQLLDMLVIQGLREMVPVGSSLNELELIMRDRGVFKYSISGSRKGSYSLYLDVSYTKGNAVGS